MQRRNLESPEQTKTVSLGTTDSIYSCKGSRNNQGDLAVVGKQAKPPSSEGGDFVGSTPTNRINADYIVGNWQMKHKPYLVHIGCDCPNNDKSIRIEANSASEAVKIAIEDAFSCSVCHGVYAMCFGHKEERKDGNRQEMA